MDVVIVGGGIVGLILANLLADQTNLSITMLEINEPILSWEPTHYDARCSAITRAAEKILDSIGVWQDILAQRVGVYDHMHVWEYNSGAAISFKASDLGEDNLGHIVENSLMQFVLWSKIIKSMRVTVCRAKPTKITQLANSTRIYFADRYLDTSLIIGCDGAASWLRGIANIPAYRHDYRQAGLVATIKSSKSHLNTAMQCFTADGPLAFLPLNDSFLSSIVWSMNTELAQELCTLETKLFCQRLAAAYAYKLGDLELIGKRHAFPLQLLHAQQYIAPRIALVGDAIHVTHPLAGQGLNMGIVDAATLAAILVSVAHQGRDIGAGHVLRKYERARKGSNIASLAGADLINRVFTISDPGLQKIRNWGVNLLDRSLLAKRILIRSALGLNDRIEDGCSV